MRVAVFAMIAIAGCGQEKTVPVALEAQAHNPSQ